MKLKSGWALPVYGSTSFPTKDGITVNSSILYYNGDGTVAVCRNGQKNKFLSKAGTALFVEAVNTERQQFETIDIIFK